MEYTRLHITPFNASLLSAIVPPSMSSLAKNISFHNIETFPEKAYGYVELPKEQATKIKQKLNGAVLRGSKIVIQEARAAPRIVSPDPEMAKREKKRKEKKAKGEIPQPEEKLEDSAPKEKNRKRKRHDEPLQGQEVTDRQIKRGWTDPNAESKAQKKEKRSRDKDLDKQAKKDKKAEREKSKYTTGAEALIRTTLPPNVILPAKGIEGVVVDKKAKKSKSGKKDVVIHEFARTEKFATFLRQKALPGAAKPAVEFREGEGWFDEDGNKVGGEPPKSNHNYDLLETIKEENKLKKLKKLKKEPTPELKSEESEEEDLKVAEAAPKMIYNSDSETSSSGSSASDSEEEESADKAEGEKKDDIEDIFAAVDSSLDSDTQKASSPAAKSVDEIMAEVSSPAKYSSPSPPPSAKKAVEEPVYIHTTTTTSSSARPVTPVSSSLKIAIPENPLEAIFKPKKAAEKEEKSETPFSFGNLGADIDSDYEEEEEFTIEQAPMTPFTQQDVAWRNVRSAAPTPDTAHPSRKHMNGWPVNEDEEDVNGFNSRSSPTETAKGGKGKKGDVGGGPLVGEEEGPKGTDPNADFQKWFYENRGDTNRTWKKRRKEVKKEVRQRENRKGGNNKLQ